MNPNTWLKHYRKRRKIRRVKPHFWHLESAGVGYVQNYKAGTRSIRQALALHLLRQRPENKDRRISYSEVTEEQVEMCDKRHSGFHTPGAIRENWPELAVFTFVRNPLSRLYSCYANKVLDAGKRGGKLPFAALGVTSTTTFDEFVRMVADTPDARAERHFRSQTWFITAGGRLITGFIGKIENFNADWEVLRKRHGLPEPPHYNRSSMGARDFRGFYSPETYRLALERYRTDIEALGYGNDV